MRFVLLAAGPVIEVELGDIGVCMPKYGGRLVENGLFGWVDLRRLLAGRGGGDARDHHGKE